MATTSSYRRSKISILQTRSPQFNQNSFFINLNNYRLNSYE
nr:MAG TPA: hypothetical protein [Caudoviricetes sp.]